MNKNGDIDTYIKDLGEKIDTFDKSSDGNDGMHVKLNDGDEARVSNLMDVSKDEILGENEGLIDRVGVDAKAKKRKEFSGGDGESGRVELSDSGVRKGDKGKERRMKRIEKVEKFDAGNGVEGSGLEIGDLVWGKVKSHPWWPGQIYNEKLASPEVCKLKMAGYVLVAFFGDCSYGWFDPAELVRFESSYAEKSRQMSSRTFVKAVEEAVDEASRRRTLGLACRCRNSYNFRPTTVEGYVSVDVGDYESGSVYSVDQIRKSRDDFKPTEVLDFVNQLALSPIKVKHEDIEFVKNKATALAYRKAVYVEFDETYAQAFGYEPEHPSRRHTQGLNQPPKVANPAPLSGPLVIAEVLGKGKGSSKSCKSRECVKKDQYLFKRRDEINDLKASVQVLPGQTASSEKPVYVDGSVAIAAGERAVQKKSTKVSKKNKASAKHQGTESSMRDEVSDQRLEAGGKGEMRDDKPSGLEIGHTDSQMNLVNSSNNKAAGEAPSQSFQAYEAKPFQNEGKVVGLKNQESSRSEVGVGHAGINISDSVVDIPCPVDVKHEEAHLMALKSVGRPQQSIPAKTEVHGEQAYDGGVGHPLGTGNAKSRIGGQDINNGTQAKKVKVRKRPAEKLNSDNSMPLMKKKRKKELLSSENMKSSLSGGEIEPSVQSIAKSPVHVATSSREDLHVEPQGKEGKISFETILAQKMSQVEKIELEPPELLHSLKTLAHSFTGGSNSSMAAVRQAFLRYRSLVFEKSLVLLPATGSESTETCISDTKAIDIPAEDVRERRLIKPHRQVARPDDPSKGGLKRGPSDRQEEIAAKKKKKIDDMIELKAKKKAAQKTPVLQQGDVIKEASGQTMKSLKPAPFKGACGPTMKSPKPPSLTEASGPIKKSLKPAPLKKTEPSSKALGPMMLVMKFPPQGTLPSIMELKARFARFGQLDHSATRIYWKTSTCRLVYRHRVDAEAACRFASSTRNLFGNTDVRCYTREVEVAASVAEQGKVHKEDSSMGTSQLTDLAVEQRPARSLPLRTPQQPGGQPKSILKKPNGDETSGTTGGGKGTRVRFSLGEEETNRGGEQLMIGNKNINNNASFFDGAASSSTNHGLDFNSKNIVIPTSPMPILPVPTAVNSLRPPNYLHHTELAPRNGHNFNSVIAPSMTPSLPNVDISQQMMGLLNKCNDVVNKVTDFLGYAPLHPL